MKQIVTAILIFVFIISLISFSFTFNQVTSEEKRLENDIQYRSSILANSLKESVEPNFINKSDTYLQDVVERFADNKRFAGLAVVDNKGTIVAVSSSLPKEISDAQKIAADVMDGDKESGDFVNFENKKMYIFASPLHDNKSVVGSLIVVQNAGYIDSRLIEIWKNNLMRLFVQISLLAIAVTIIVHWLIYKPVKNLTESLRLARTGSNDANKFTPSSLLFQPLTKEISNIRRSLLEAKLAASEEARASLEKLDLPWTAERLKQFVKDILKDRTIVVISNREPYIHTKNGSKIDYYFPASGMVTAIEPVMQATGGTWIAHGSGDADRLVVDKNDTIQVPPDDPKYTLKRVWLSKKEEEGYYNGFSNEGIWPLCHRAYTRPIFRKEDWEEYKAVNNKFAQAILSQIKNEVRPIIFVQDFHLALVPQMVKQKRPDVTIGIFWHIPWPNSESFIVCPWKKEILDGILGADIVGFHTQLHCLNFIETVRSEVESLVDLESFSVMRNSHTSFVKSFPISIEFPSQDANLDPKDREKILKAFSIKTPYVGVGIDRLDYTKGIPERFKAVEIFLRKYPSYQEQFTFLQVSVPSRTAVKRYKEFRKEVESEAERINSIYKKNGWKPIELSLKQYNREEVTLFYKLANFCMVTSLDDGMNLVAKEFVASRVDEKGVLILSEFTGASRQLKNALLVNPYNGEKTADTIKKALEMSQVEQITRMREMREEVRTHNIFLWSAEIIKALVSLG